MKTTNLLVNYLTFLYENFFFIGKGPCDRKAAVIKGETRRSVNEKNDCCNSVQFVNAAKSTKHLSIFACNVTDVNKKKVTLPNITKYNNIEFEISPVTRAKNSISANNQPEFELSMTTWRAFQVGAGKKVKYSNLKSTVNTIETLEVIFKHLNNNWKLEKKQHDDDNDDDEENPNNNTSSAENDMEVDQLSLQPRLLSSGFYLFDCPHPKCVKQFRRYFNLDKHLTIGKHIFAPTTVPLIDKAKLFYKGLIENDSNRVSFSLNQFNSLLSKTTSSTSTTRLQGWALPQKKPPTHYSIDVVNFLESAFNEGVVTGNKWDPAALSQEMVFANSNGQPRFNENDFLSPEQIKAYFSKLKAKRSKECTQSQSQPSTPLPSSSSNSVTDKNTPVKESKKIINDDDSDENEISDEQIEDFDSAVENSHLGYICSVTESILQSGSSS
ncbi:unnamed protein product [Adineta ricciae]|uniref:C2H2-type domain-containing protein n=1 Tax=Adineta ricciae TaxID=249248 RepID=A0A815R4Z3_ADIRI|nr:unnamed protein product [Adineta ricciae]